MLLRSKDNLLPELLNFIKGSDDVLLMSPFIKLSALRILFKDNQNIEHITIITKWKPHDIAHGFSDISVFPFCKKRNIPLLLNSNIHLKTIIRDNMNSAWIGSANITQKGLGISEAFNYEIGAIIPKLALEDKLYFDKIIQESYIVNEEYYLRVKDQVSKIKVEKIPKVFKVKVSSKQSDFLLSSLPMSESLDLLTDIYLNRPEGKSQTDIRSAIHDINLYNIDHGLNKNKFKEQLTTNFFLHPFVKELLAYNGSGRHFGDLSAWMHSKCTTVPTPRRFDIKEALIRVRDLIISLSSNYRVEIPGRQSEVLKRIRG